MLTIIAIVIVVVFIPKIVDSLFSIYLCDFTALKIVDAHDVISFIGAVIGGACSLVAVLVTVKHFKIEKRPIIIPRNKIVYFYQKFECIYMLQNTLNIEKEPDLGSKYNHPEFVLENISSCAAISFDIEIEYNKGEWFKKLCSLANYDPTQVSDCTYEKEQFAKQGVFNANSDRFLIIPKGLEYIIVGLCRMLSDPTVDEQTRNTRWEHFIKKTHKIAEIKIQSEDTIGNVITDIFDINIEITDTISKPIYEVRTTFAAQKH